MANSEKATIIQEFAWKVQRFAKVEEVELSTGSIRFRVKIWDGGREPFVTQWFNDPQPAMDFIERVQLDNERFVQEEV